MAALVRAEAPAGIPVGGVGIEAVIGWDVEFVVVVTLTVPPFAPADVVVVVEPAGWPPPVVAVLLCPVCNELFDEFNVELAVVCEITEPRASPKLALAAKALKIWS